MPNSGYPTPDSFEEDATFTCIPIVVPNKPEFMAAIYGLYGQMSNDWFWKSLGTMPVSEAAYLSSKALALTDAYAECGGTMTCEEIADCIETSVDVQDALSTHTNNTLISGGFTPNPSASTASDIKPISTAQQQQNALAIDVDCASPAQNMAIARAVVRELHEAMVDTFESLELATNAVEAANIATDGTPILGTLNNVTELADWYLETLQEFYQASYNQSTEDDCACAIFCHLQSTCSLSLEDLIGIYSGLGGQIPSNIDDFQAAITETINFTLNVSVATVATAHLFVLWLLRFGGGAFGLGGWNTLANTIQTASTYEDFSYDVCDDCPVIETPTTYWKMYLDFRVSQWGTESVVWNGAPNDGSWQSNGYAFNYSTATTLNVAYGHPDVFGGVAFVVKAVAQQSVRRGSKGNGTNDIASVNFYPNANYAGTVGTWGTGFITANTNDVRSGLINASAVTAFRSAHFRSRVFEAANTGNGVLRVYSAVIWGIPNVGNVKPVGSAWAGNILPATIADLFP